MRDPARIDPIIDVLRAEWHRDPDLRLTQLAWSLATPAGESAPRFFNTEDDVVVDALIWRGIDRPAHDEETR